MEHLIIDGIARIAILLLLDKVIDGELATIIVRSAPNEKSKSRKE